jgi:ABC-type uncharacterized transport system substrate-binding protein
VTLDIRLKACGCFPTDVCDHPTDEAAAAEMAQILHERPPIVLHTGPNAQKAMQQIDATHPLLIAMRAAATNRYDPKGMPR